MVHRCVRKHRLSILHGKQIDLNSAIGTVSPVTNPVNRMELDLCFWYEMQQTGI
jgi:hypothetical protein